MRLVYLATHPVTAFRLMDGQLAFMREQGFDVTLITSPGPLLDQVAAREQVRTIGVPMTRELSPGADAVALARITVLLRQLRPALVNAGTPKAGLLGVTAARLAGVPIVVYLLRGLRFEGARGARRLLLAATEHVAASMADRVFSNSESLRDRFVALGCAPASKVWVPADGSSNGVDVARFAPSAEKRAWAQTERARLGIPGDAFVVGFVGRFVKDKGLGELLTAFRDAATHEPKLRLLLVGDADGTDPLPESVLRVIAEDPRIHTTGFVEEPARFYSLMDLFAFPSFREGFPNAVLEAAAAELPTVAFRAIGSRDAVVDGATGTLLEIGDVSGLSRALLEYSRTPERARRHGAEAHQRVEQKFSRERVWRALADEYRRLGAASPLARLGYAPPPEP